MNEIKLKLNNYTIFEKTQEDKENEFIQLNKIINAPINEYIKTTNLMYFHKIRLVSRSQPSQVVSINLNQWKLLQSSGAHWIFSTLDQKNKGEQKQTHQYQSGRYVIRMRKSKEFQKFTKRTSREIGMSYLQNEKQEKMKNQQLEQLDKNNEQNIERNIKSNAMVINKQKQNKKQKKNNQQQVFYIYQHNLNNLIQQVYSQFLKQTVSNRITSNKLLLPLISQSIVRPSSQYFIQQTINSEQSHQQQTIAFVQFIGHELMCHHLANELLTKQLQQNGQVDQEVRWFVNGLINKRMDEQPLIVNGDLLVECKLQQVVVTFEENQLYYTGNYQQSAPQQNETCQPFSHQTLTNKSHKLFQVIELKPKTILPDIYNQQFITYYLTSYQQLHLMNCSQSKCFSSIKQVDNDLQPIIKEVIQSSLQTVSQQNTTYEKKQLTIQSTRWFKKNCLSKKKNHYNPLSYFGKCLTDNYRYVYQQQTINFYSQKHLKQRLLLNAPIDITYINTTLKQNKPSSSSLHSIIIDHININKNKSPMTHQFHSQSNINQNGQSLSFMEQILSLQLIDLPDDEYMDVLKIQNLTESLIKDISIQNNLRVQLQKQQTNIHNQTVTESCNNKQTLYPSNVRSVISSLFRQQVYNRSKQLSQLLKNIISTNQTIEKNVIQIFCIKDHKIFNLNNHRQLQSTDINLTLQQIRKKLYYIVRFLIALTWKDISLMIQSLTTTNCNKNISQVTQLKSITNNNKQQIIKCAIIDYGIKNVQNIRKNLQKQLQFLYCYQQFVQSRSAVPY